MGDVVLLLLYFFGAPVKYASLSFGIAQGKWITRISLCFFFFAFESGLPEAYYLYGRSVQVVDKLYSLQMLSTYPLLIDSLNGVDGGFYLFSHTFSAIFLFIPACLHMEFKVPCGMLLLFRGTITTLVLSSYHPSKTSSFPCLFSVMPIWLKTHATSRLDKFLSILKAQRYRFETLLLQLVFWKKECF